jgi:protein TonB
MKFVELHSRGGDYFVVAANIAYLRADENGQTKVGLIGGDSLLVVGSMAEIVAQITAGEPEAKA